LSAETVRLVLSPRASFDPVFGGRKIVDEPVDEQGTYSLQSLSERGQVSVWRSSQGAFLLSDVFDADWESHDWGREVLIRRSARSTSELLTDPVYLKARIESIESVDREHGRYHFNTLPAVGARASVVAGRRGTPSPFHLNVVSDADGEIVFGPLPDGEWYLDVSMDGHCPVRVRAPLARTRDGLSGWVPMFRSRERTGQIRVLGDPPPSGSTLLVIVEGYQTISTYYRIEPNGSFSAREPIGGWIEYQVKLPDGRSKVVRRSDDSSELRIDID